MRPWLDTGTEALEGPEGPHSLVGLSPHLPDCWPRGSTVPWQQRPSQAALMEARRVPKHPIWLPPLRRPLVVPSSSGPAGAAGETGRTAVSPTLPDHSSLPLRAGEPAPTDASFPGRLQGPPGWQKAGSRTLPVSLGEGHLTLPP